MDHTLRVRIGSSSRGGEEILLDGNEVWNYAGRRPPKFLFGSLPSWMLDHSLPIVLTPGKHLVLQKVFAGCGDFNSAVRFEDEDQNPLTVLQYTTDIKHWLVMGPLDTARLWRGDLQNPPQNVSGPSAAPENGDLHLDYLTDGNVGAVARQLPPQVARQIPYSAQPRSAGTRNGQAGAPVRAETPTPAALAPTSPAVFKRLRTAVVSWRLS